MKHHTNFAIAITLCAMVSGCDRTTSSKAEQTTPPSTAQTDLTQNVNTDISTENTSTQSIPSTQSPAPSEPTVTPVSTTAVTPNGFGGLNFGQEITDELLDDLGLVKDDDIINESCYYVHDPKLTYMDKEHGERASVLYQIIDGKVASISIQDPKIPFYTGVNIGDAPATVLQTHKQVSYEVDKYSTDGDFYELIYNVNFDVTNPPAMGQVLTKENYQLNDNAKKYNQSTPLQIKYQFRDGQSLGQTDIAADAWTDEQKGKLTGTLYNIDIGEPHAIYLVEGCS